MIPKERSRRRTKRLSPFIDPEEPYSDLLEKQLEVVKDVQNGLDDLKADLSQPDSALDSGTVKSLNRLGNKVSELVEGVTKLIGEVAAIRKQESEKTEATGNLIRLGAQDNVEHVQQHAGQAENDRQTQARVIGIPVKEFFRIGEVSEILDIEPYVLRHWESYFEVCKPARNRANQKIYTRKHVELFQDIKRLLYSEKFTINGAKKRLQALKMREKLHAKKLRPFI